MKEKTEEKVEQKMEEKMEWKMILPEEEIGGFERKIIIFYDNKILLWAVWNKKKWTKSIAADV